MTIDEAMKKIKEKMACDYNISGCDTCDISSCEDRDIIIQLAEWLEELKVIKDGSIPIIHGKAELELHDKAIRNKALDDFVGRLIEELSHTTLLKDGYYLANIIKPLAEQLKAGGENEYNI